MIYHPLIIYGLKMAKGQLTIVVNAEPIDEYVKRNDVSDSIKYKLNLVTEIKQFAIDSLGLAPTTNYTTFYNHGNKPIIWVLTAANPFELKAKEWQFPILGNVPYKGFFNKEEAMPEYYRLKSEGYDVKLSTTSGWSTLGWFNDPVLSAMLSRSEGNIAEVIIHELTHGTVFIKNNVQYNENLASVIGYEGAKQFLIQKYGANSDELNEYVNSTNDEKIFSNYVLKGSKQLDSLYSTFASSMNDAQKTTMKNTLLLHLMGGIINLPLKNKLRYIQASKRMYTAKNAFFMEYVRYNGDDKAMSDLLNITFKNNISKFVEDEKKKVN